MGLFAAVSGKDGNLAAALALGAASVLIWAMIGADLDLRYAWSGWSGMDWVNHLTLTANFARDFPGGITVYEKSAFMHIYPLAGRWLGLDPETIPKVVLAIELTAIAAASCVLAGTLVARRRLLIGTTVFVLLAASLGPNLDLARFGMPYPFGLYYYVAEGCRLAAVALALRRRYAASGLLLGLAAVNHLAMAAYAGIFIAAIMALTPRDFLSRGAVLGAALFAATALPWFYSQYLFDSAVSITAAEAPHELWLPLMVAFSYHFFPVQFGAFAEFAAERFLPLFSFFALFSYYLRRLEVPRDVARRLTIGVLAMVALTVAGVVVSVAAPAPFLVKLSLHRASLMAVLAALPVVVGGLWQDITEGGMIRRLVAAAALLAAFFLQPGWPLVCSLILCLPAWRAAIGRDSAAGDRVAVVLLLTAVTLAVIYHATGYVAHSSSIYWATRGTWELGAIVLAAGIVLGWLIRTEEARTVAGLAGILAACAGWLIGHALSPGQLQLYADYKTAQVWARDNSSVTALFMPDPSIYYGWRDYSQRSSFGNLREWLYTSWAYTSRSGGVGEGLDRFREFGIPLEPYLNLRPSFKGTDALTAKVNQAYNTAGDSWRRALAAKYGIDYFVINKRDWKGESTLPVAFENASFRILRVAPADGAR